ncbi:hypothetical protein PG997_002042 [Apiospora hydei]|uniref:Fungal N-terminal domain-containing protein n=1 Tax=Apiospora hydei TaxID=1337664 RepID=A0ABR1X876_9PEZI
MAEALSLGANVIAFVVVAAQLAKKTYETFSAITDGPEIVKRVASRVNQIHWILEGLKDNKTALEDSALAGHLQLCFDEIRKSSCADREIAAIAHGAPRRAIMEETTVISNLRMQSASGTLVYNLKNDFSKIGRQIQGLEQTLQTQARSYTSEYSYFTDSMDRKIQCHSETLHSSLLSVQSGISSLCKVSGTKGDEMIGLLADIKALLLTEEGHGSKAKGESLDKVQPDNPVFSVDHRPGHDKLLFRIKRLCSLIEQDGQTIDTYNDEGANGEACDRIIEDLEDILGLAAEYGQTSTYSSSHKGLDRNPEHDSKFVIRRLKRSFGQQTLQINQPARKRRKVCDGALKTSRSYTTIDLDIGTMTLLLNQSRRLLATGQIVSSITDYTISATFLPADPDKFNMIVATVVQEQMKQGAINSISSLSVNRFSMGHPEICKFLIDKGLDVDLVAKYKLARGYRQCCALDVQPCADYEAYPSQLQRILTCRRQLLQAGADPTINIMDYNIIDGLDFIQNAVHYGVKESLRLAFDRSLTGHFRTVNTPLPDGNTPLLAHCQNGNFVYDINSLRTLVDLGADLTASDFLGNTCLHLCVLYAISNPIRDHMQTFEAICYLLLRGADPKAVDVNGSSVSSLAYASGYAGDLWDSVLQSCGFNIEDFRCVHMRRKARYSNCLRGPEQEYNYERTMAEYSGTGHTLSLSVLWRIFSMELGQRRGVGNRWEVRQ